MKIQPTKPVRLSGPIQQPHFDLPPIPPWVDLQDPFVEYLAKLFGRFAQIVEQLADRIVELERWKAAVEADAELRAVETLAALEREPT